MSEKQTPIGLHDLSAAATGPDLDGVTKERNAWLELDLGVEIELARPGD